MLERTLREAELLRTLLSNVTSAEPCVRAVLLFASMAHEVAPEHGRSSYGEPSAGLAPSDIYMRGHAEDALTKAKGARETAKKALNRMNVQV